MDTINLDKLREQDHLPKNPFEHQREAFAALDEVFSFEDSKDKSGLLVFPTGAGKTFTAVNWLCNNALPRNVKILWLAHSLYLLDQAYSEFHKNAGSIPSSRNILNIRLVSSHPGHDNVSSIQLTDDVVIMSTQTAIRNLHTNALDNFGNTMVTNFRKFIEHCEQTGLFIVLDEAHHAPAYGCRNLLIGEQEQTPGIGKIVSNLRLLGLTATPTYTDETKRGWLGKIFRDGENGIIYEAKKPDLIAKNILAAPKYIEMPTGREFEVDDNLYNRLVREHKDLPEYIISKLADDHQRNDYIVNEYVKNRDQYGKTIIFADRWFQCVYLKEKLQERGVRADAIYSKIDADPGSAEARNQRTSTDNARILNEFRNDELDVLINVRMLTEGVDVPDVKTVFITRQTTSSILMAQMIGRALRGRRAGGKKSQANIVLFVDEWKRLIDWATPSLEGGVEPDKPVTRGYYPLEYISIRLVEELSKQINAGEPQALPFSQFVPIGWYQTEITVSSSEDNFDGMQTFVEFVMVYEHTRTKYDAFMAKISESLPDEWAKEYLSQAWMLPQVHQWIDDYFDRENDDIGNVLDLNLIKLARHIAQRQTLPTYHPFEERDRYNLDTLARKLLYVNAVEQQEVLSREFSKPGNLWKVFYKSFSRFQMAFYGALARELRPPSPPPPPPPPRIRELTEEEKRQVMIRDGHTCLSCGVRGPGIRLEIDHILPFNMGGETNVDNSQTLCSICNREKGINEINFRYNSTQLSSPKELDLLPQYRTENVRFSITRLVNFFYHCQAVCQIDLGQTKYSEYYDTWEIELYAGNNPEWLLRHKKALVKHIQDEFDCPHVKDIKVRGIYQATETESEKPINFQINRTPLAVQPETFREFSFPPNDKANDPKEWEVYLRRCINFFYQCSAVESINLSSDRRFFEWRINLHEGNDPAWLKPHLEKFLNSIHHYQVAAGAKEPRAIKITAPSKPRAAYFIESPSTKPPISSTSPSSGKSTTQTSSGGLSKRNALSILPDGTLCRFSYKEEQFEGKISEGKIVVPDKGKFTTFSGASNTLTGTTRNGWKDWELRLPGTENWILAHDWWEKRVKSDRA